MRRTHRPKQRLVTAFAILLAAVLALVAMLNTVTMMLALAVAVGVLALAVLGRERVGILVLMVSFAMAPAYKGLSPSVGSSVTPMDVLLVLGIGLIAPSLLSRRFQFPSLYLAGLGIILVTGSIGSLSSPGPALSFLQFIQWLIVLGVLVGFFALWRPPWVIVDRLLWSYVAGQMLSILDAFATGPSAVTGRYQGLSHHPNAFAEGGVMAFAILLYMFHRHHGWRSRGLIVIAAVASVESTVLSGSRAALLVIAGLLVLVPFVERSAVAGFAWAGLGALGIAMLPFVASFSGSGSALSRLAGTGDATYSDNSRTSVFDTGLHMFLDHPLLGNGFTTVTEFHDLFLSAAVAGGLFCLVGYLMVLTSLARPLFGQHVRRRMAYLSWAFIAITPTVPWLDDRTLWVPLSLVVLIAGAATGVGSDPGSGLETADVELVVVEGATT